MDDIIWTGNSSKLLQSFTSTLSNHFAMKDLRDVITFFGILVKRHFTCIFLLLHKYFDDLHKFHLHTVKLVTPPSAAHTFLCLTNGERRSD